MKQRIKRIIYSIPLFGDAVKAWSAKRFQRSQIREWEAQGRPPPPPHGVKQRILRGYAKKYGLRVLVETGTYMGDMIEALKREFDEVYSIELSRELHENAKRRFEGDRHVTLLCGDSAIELEKLVKRIDRPALFWLDGHYSSGVTAKADKETPIMEELNHLLAAPDLGHVILIDDARSFGSFKDYPTIEEVRTLVMSKRDNVDFAVETDIIRIVPKA